MPGRRTFSVLVIFGVLGAAVGAALLAWQSERDAAASVNDAHARQVALVARQDVGLLTGGLRGAGAVLTPSGELDPTRFRSFARDVLARTQFRFLGWGAPVSAGQRAEFEREMGVRLKQIDSGETGGFEPVPRRGRRDHLPIAEAFPPGPARRLIGYDVLSGSVRSRTALDALESGRAQMTPPVALAGTGAMGAIVFSPVMAPDGGAPPGLLVAGVAGARLAASISRQLEFEGEIAIEDDGEMLAGEVPEHAASSDVRIVERDWTVFVEGQAEPSVAPAIAWGGGGLALALAIAVLLWAAARRERDLSERRAEAELHAARESLFVRIGEAIEREIEGDARLGSLARELVPAVGDICVVHEVTEWGNVRRVGVAAPDERTTELLTTQPEPAPNSPIRAAIASRQPVLYTRVSDANADREQPVDPATIDDLRASERSNMIIPLVARGRVLGTLSISILRSSRRAPLTRDDVAFAMELAAHAAVALDNARLYERQRDIAAILQGALVPRELVQPPTMSVAARHRSGMAGTEVGGDFYDLFEVAGKWMAVLGDVCGKGPEAAALTALARHTIRATARLGPAGAVRRVHEAIQASDERTYCTLCCIELTPRDDGIDTRFTVAGHPEPRIVAADGAVSHLPVTGPLVGALEDPRFAQRSLRIAPGSLLFMFSDGVPEARRGRDVFGDHRLDALLAALHDEDLSTMLQRIEGEVVSFVDDRPRDDLALFALRAD